MPAPAFDPRPIHSYRGPGGPWRLVAEMCGSGLSHQVVLTAYDDVRPPGRSQCGDPRIRSVRTRLTARAMYLPAADLTVVAGVKGQGVTDVGVQIGPSFVNAGRQRPSAARRARLPRGFGYYVHYVRGRHRLIGVRALRGTKTVACVRRCVSPRPREDGPPHEPGPELRSPRAPRQ